jgi:hypothetical protein
VVVSDISVVVAPFLGLRLWAEVSVLANFVLSHPACNRSKSDTLAAKQHLHKWLDFVQTNADNLSQIGYDSGIMADQGSMNSVARWGYASAVQGGSQAWIRSTIYEPIHASYLGAWA